MTEFWVSSGHHLTHRHAGGGIVATDELILAYLARPEVLPPGEACDAERALHASLTHDPRRAVAAAEIAALADPDARENWEFLVGFRDRLFAAPTIEAAYRGLIRDGAGVPPLFMNHLAHLILRNALDECEDPYLLRAAELFFRQQRVSVTDGAAMLADAELIEAQEVDPHASPLLAMMGHSPVKDLDVLTAENAWSYWSRSDAFSMVLNLGGDTRARDALAAVIERWVGHLTGVGVTVEPLQNLTDEDWRWFVGLDAEATRLGNLMWRGGRLTEEEEGRILALFRLTFEDGAPVIPEVAGHPVYLIMAMTQDRHLRLKPQNLIAGLPFRPGAVS
ncbi:MAG: DUF6352 family protein [Burkholderiales bacterium]|jgi:hypothetical protein|nr:DUF6352 family protein [Burkholderiales bacterium]